jgi:AAA domain/Bifunctional DNA primase/polymerase, N-terminal
MPGNGEGRPLSEERAASNTTGPAKDLDVDSTDLEDFTRTDMAQKLAAAGMYVFPVDHPDLPICIGIGDGHRSEEERKQCQGPDRGKHPHVAFTHAADTNPKMIHMWWAGSPRNIGINVGKSGLLVIDEDTPGGFAKYAADHGVTIPPTFIVKTGKGRHYYFKDTQNGALSNQEGALTDYGINVRSGNAYVVGPGSKHFSGFIYRVERGLAVAPLPDWVVDAIKAKTNGHKTDGDGVVWEDVRTDDFDRFELPAVIKDGQRDNILHKHASSMRARGVPIDVAELAMMAAWARCEQPPKAKTPYSRDSALAKLHRAYNRYEDGRSEDPAAVFAEEVEREARKIRVRAAAERKVRIEQSGPLPPFDAGTLREMLARPQPPPGRIDGLIPWEASTLIAAQRKTGKTTLLLNLSRSLLTGESFLGSFEVQPIDGLVALLNYEVSGDTMTRWADEAGLDRDRFFLVNLRSRRNPLADPEDRDRLAQLLRQGGAETLLVDPFSRAYTGKSQNDSAEVGGWLVELDRFTRNDVGARDLILTAHAGWNQERTRGSSALEDWADSIITMTRDDSEDADDERYLRAIGRDVDLEEDQLNYDPTTRTLTLAGTGSRKTAKNTRRDDQLDKAVLEVATAEPGLNTTQLGEKVKEAGVGFQRGDIGHSAGRLVDKGHLRLEPGPRGAKQYYPTENLFDEPM